MQCIIQFQLNYVKTILAYHLHFALNFSLQELGLEPVVGDLVFDKTKSSKMSSGKIGVL